MRWAKTLMVLSLMLGTAAPGWAQDETRPAMTTNMGDTGLWFVPTAETLPTKAFSFSLQRTEEKYRQGNTNVSYWPVTAGVGVWRLELFGSLRMITRIDRDTSPLLFAGPNNEAGGLVNDYPSFNATWSGNHLGDLYGGVKLNVLSQQHNQPFALAVRGIAKFPTASTSNGIGTGQYDGIVDAIASREFHNVELSGYYGVALRGDPPGISISDSYRWGGGAAFPTRKPLRFTAELYGENMFDHAVTTTPGFIVGTDGSLAPQISNLDSEVNTAVGLTWQTRGGMLLGAAFNYKFDLAAKDPTSDEPAGTSRNAFGLQLRVGFHRGLKNYVRPPAIALTPPEAPPVAEAPPAPAPAPAPPSPPAPVVVANRAPTVRASCDPCKVKPGETLTLRAQSNDPDGDQVAVQWSTSGGTLNDTRASDTTWRAESAPGIIRFTVRADDGRGGIATDTVSVEVAAEAIAFHDVLFDFNSAQLKRESIAALDAVVTALNQDPGAQLLIEGHTCNYGTEAYNMALGARRASAVQAYLVKQGIAASRLSTVSHGSDQPTVPNTSEANRKLNRRAVMTVRSNNSSQ